MQCLRFGYRVVACLGVNAYRTNNCTNGSWVTHDNRVLIIVIKRYILQLLLQFLHYTQIETQIETQR